MNRNQFIVVVSLASLLLGCRPKSRGTHVPEPNPPASNTTSADERISDLERYSVELSALSKSLPGRDEAENRQVLGDAFDRATSALSLLMGPQPGGSFRQQLRIIDNVRRDVRSGSTSEATIDSGIRAIFNALIGVRDRLFATDVNVRGDLDNLRDKVLELDAVRGPLHQVSVAAAYQAAAATIETMRKELQNRVAASVPTTQPTQ
jgi:hypothetical protein